MDEKISIELTGNDIQVIMLGLTHSDLPSREASRLCSIIQRPLQKHLTVKPKKPKKGKKK